VSSTVPLWVALVGPAAAILVTAITLWFTNRREAQRQGHELRLKEKELEAGHAARLRDERITAYRKLLAATTTAHTERESVAALSEAYAEISLLAGSKELDRAAARVWVEYGKTQKVASKKSEDWGPDEDPAADFAQALTRAGEAKNNFLFLARKELQVEQPRREDAAEG
jgi:hypothetical protein